MAQRRIDSWIKRFLATEPPRAKSLVVTIFGDAIAPRGDWIWLQSLIDLLRPFDVNDRLVRSSVFRLVKDEWLIAERHGRRSRYAFTPSGQKRFERAHDKIYFPRDELWNSEWTVVIAPSSEISSTRREPLRRELLWQGFRVITPGTFVRPDGDRIALAEILERLRLTSRVIVCSAKENDLKLGSLRSLIARYWDLRLVVQNYRRFIGSVRPMIDLMLRLKALAPEQAFVIRTLLIHAFRRVLLHDPLLPSELLPDPWPGREAYDLCRAAYRRTYSASQQYMSNVLGPAAAMPSPYFNERFGGLSSPPTASKLVSIRS